MASDSKPKLYVVRTYIKAHSTAWGTCALATAQHYIDAALTQKYGPIVGITVLFYRAALVRFWPVALFRGAAANVCCCPFATNKLDTAGHRKGEAINGRGGH